MSRLSLALVALTVSLSAVLLPEPALAAGDAPEKWKGTLRAAVKQLTVATEVRDGYDRDLFRHWVDADGDGCDSRDEVLIAEARKGPTIGAHCALSNGKWVSYYDKARTRDPSTFDIDHMVPLAEAWDSGARTWDEATREAFANDLGDPRSLVAVSASSNRSKSDQDPAEWLPAKGRCRYVREYVAVKIRWSLTIDRPEKRALTKKAKSCKRVRVKVVIADVAAGQSPAPDPDPAPPTDGDLRVTSITYDPPGTDDDANLNNELVVLANTTDEPLDLAGWQLSDGASHTYTFGGVTLGAGASVRLRSGDGMDSVTDLYASWGYVWNNSGDAFTLRAPDGSTVQAGSYQGGGSGTATF